MSGEDAAGLIEAYYAKGWTDGLPVIPPTEDSVGDMLAAGGFRGPETIGEIPDRNAKVTAEKVAINAVLAGCRPEYMPVVAAAVKGLCHPDYHYHSPATSTGGSCVVLIVNGPIGPKLDINCRDNIFGPGWRANATIGRAIRLVMMNALNTRPGPSGLDRSTLGNPGKYTCCFAENEAESPWEPLHVERGFKRADSAVTVFAAEAHIQVYNQLSSDPEGLCLTMADAMANAGTTGIIGQAQQAIVWAGEHTEIFRRAGWTRAQVKQALFDSARRTHEELKRKGRMPGPLEPGDGTRWRHTVRTPDDLIVVHAGGKAGSFSACLPGWGNKQASRSVTIPIAMP
ncbi:MAG: hypothetical protein ACHQZQ_00920 [SAR324 cluster bacterium]